MDSFRLLTRTRQSTDYSCGASALQAVLSYWGKDIGEAELMMLLKTNSDVGTYPENIVAGARALGFKAESRDHLTIDDLRDFTASGKPAIGLAQVWRSYADGSHSAEDEWESGHYIVILGVDDDYVYFQDPFIRMSKAFVPRPTFEDHWHHAMGGDRQKNPDLVHLAVFIEGDSHAGRPPSPSRNLGDLDLRNLGALNLLVIEFEKPLLPFDFLNATSPLWSTGDVRPDAFVFVRKDAEGRVSGLEGSRLEDETDMTAVSAVMATITDAAFGPPGTVRSRVATAIEDAAAGDFGLSAADLRKLGESLRPSSSALAVLVENVWERKLKDIAKEFSGALTKSRLIGSEAIEEAVQKLSSTGNIAS